MGTTPSEWFPLLFYIPPSSIFDLQFHIMAFTGLNDFINLLEKSGELIRTKTFADPLLEIAEITDRVTKNNGKALLFENTGTNFPLLINMFGSDKRMTLALGRENPDEIGSEIISMFDQLTGSNGNLFKKLSSIPGLLKVSGYLPSRIRRKGLCQQIIHRDPDLGILPVLKCWPYDGGRFITLPIVHTMHPVTGKTNAGMYRMQILDKNTTAMHWQRHKTGAAHFEAWKKTGKKMPVSVVLGGDPVYTYSATAPLPENIDEYILAGFLRKKKVKLVRCITNDLYVPGDADIVIEGYVDPAEDPVWEGPFGDHTGFYSLADWYPKFHVTCITHSEKAVYPATIVGIPPMEDAWFTKATEKIFLALVRLAIQPEIEDFHMPVAGVAHNLIIVKINKSYPGQGKKVISSLFGAGQMMFTKYLAVVSGEINIRNYSDLLLHILKNTDFRNDLLFSSGPLDVLDHSSDTYSMGGKLGIDGTIKLAEELSGNKTSVLWEKPERWNREINFGKNISETFGNSFILTGLPVLIVGINQSKDHDAVEKSKKWFRERLSDIFPALIIAVDNSIDLNDLDTVAWQLLGNSDPRRDIDFLSDNTLFIDGTIKAFRKGGFPRKWPNVVSSSTETINCIDRKWESLHIGPFIPSPSLKSSLLSYEGTDEVIIHHT
jgi:4-hydroxy-3-polyprenylbenzoate decarboxylase